MSTFVDELESVVDEVSTWADKTIDDIISALAPDGRGFGMMKSNIEEDLTTYRQLRNSPELWLGWIQSQTVEIQNRLMEYGVNPESVAAINPQSLAVGYAVAYSNKMEAELNKRMVK